MEPFRCIIHGSFSKHFDLIQAAAQVFGSAGIEVLAPKASELQAATDGFALFADEVGQDPRLIELLYLQNLKSLGPNGFSFFVNPGGYVGRSASYELGVAQVTNTRCFFTNRLVDHPAYLHARSVWSAENLAEYIQTYRQLPFPVIRPNDRAIHRLWVDLMVPGSIVAVGAMIEYQPRKSASPNEVLLVKTHKWGHRYSIVGGKVRRNERLQQALLREVREETGLRGRVGGHICTFDQLQGSGYYQAGVQHIFVDNVVQVHSKRVTLNDEAQEYLWAPPVEALRLLDIEPNARTTLQRYAKRVARLE
jgi:nucleoside triphosphatase